MVARNHAPDRSGNDGLKDYAATQAAALTLIIQEGVRAARCGCPRRSPTP
jgi:hypothetical protein